MKHSAADISRMTAQVAKDSARISRFMDSLTGHIDLLVDAAGANDFAELNRQAEYLAGCGWSYGCGEVAEQAKRLTLALKKPKQPLEIRRQIIRLIGACGRAGRPNAEAIG
jgi:hypothetical protein